MAKPSKRPAKPAPTSVDTELQEPDFSSAVNDSEDRANGGGTDARPSATRLDPTRYGDWEKNGRCIDF